MSKILTSLCSTLLRECYGEPVQEVGTFLMKCVTPCRLRWIIRNVSLPRKRVKLALSILIRHGFCTIEQQNERVVYTVQHKDVLLILHYESYVFYAKMLCGDLADIIVMEILINGYLTMSNTLVNVLERLQVTEDVHGTLRTIQEKFVELVEKHFLIRCPYPNFSNDSQKQKLSISEELFVVPEIPLHLLESSLTGEPSPKKQKIEYPDKGIYWKINHKKYIEIFRNESIANACANHMDVKAAEVVKIILALSENNSSHSSETTIPKITNPVPYNEILQKVLQTTSMKPEELDSYLAALCKGDESFVSKADDHSKDMFVVQIATILHKLVQSLVTSVVRDKFGAKCGRAFRILLSKKTLEVKQLEELAVLQSKESKEYVHQMVKESFITLHEIPNSGFSNKFLYLLRVDIFQVYRLILERCYHALLNLFICSEIQKGANKKQIQEVEKIDNGQRAIAEMVLLLSTWLESPNCR